MAGCRSAAPEEPAREPRRFETAPSLVKNSRVGRLRGYFPNTRLVTSDGQEVRFYDDLVKGKKVLIQFMYTQCNGI